LSELVAGAVGSSVDYLRPHLGGVYVVTAKGKKFTLVNQESHPRVRQVLVGKGRTVFDVGANRQIVKAVKMYPVAIGANLALEVAAHDARLGVHERLLELA
jgi:hypothetical protein